MTTFGGSLTESPNAEAALQALFDPRSENIPSKGDVYQVCHKLHINVLVVNALDPSMEEGRQLGFTRYADGPEWFRSGLLVRVTLPSECVSLNRPGFENHIHSRRRGGGNVGIGFIDFEGLWERAETALAFSALSINRPFHGLSLSSPTFQAAIFVIASAQSCLNCTGLM